MGVNKPKAPRLDRKHGTAAHTRDRILKSLGASKLLIVWIILMEAFCLGLGGTRLGIGFSFMSRWLLAKLVPASLPQAIVPQWGLDFSSRPSTCCHSLLHSLYSLWERSLFRAPVRDLIDRGQECNSVHVDKRYESNRVKAAWGVYLAPMCWPQPNNSSISFRDERAANLRQEQPSEIKIKGLRSALIRTAVHLYGVTA